MPYSIDYDSITSLSVFINTVTNHKPELEAFLVRDVQSMSLAELRGTAKFLVKELNVGDKVTITA